LDFGRVLLWLLLLPEGDECGQGGQVPRVAIPETLHHDLLCSAAFPYLIILFHVIPAWPSAPAL